MAWADEEVAVVADAVAMGGKGRRKGWWIHRGNWKLRRVLPSLLQCLVLVVGNKSPLVLWVILSV